MRLHSTCWRSGFDLPCPSRQKRPGLLRHFRFPRAQHLCLHCSHCRRVWAPCQAVALRTLLVNNTKTEIKQQQTAQKQGPWQHRRMSHRQRHEGEVARRARPGIGEPENEDKAESLGSSSEEYPSDGELDEELTLQSVKNLMWPLRQEPVKFYTEPFHRKLASLLIMVQSGAAPLSTIVLEARMADAVLCALDRFAR